MSIYFLSLEEILTYHQVVIEETGGSEGIINASALESAVFRPQTSFAGKYLYSTIFEMAAALFQSLAMNHAFSDGNKRTAFSCTVIFLKKNKKNIQITDKELYTFTEKLVIDHLDIPTIASWLKKHCSWPISHNMLD